MKKLSFLVALLLCIFTFSTVAYASNATTETATTEEPQVFTTEYPDDPSRAPDLVSESAIVMDAKTGQILYEKNPYEHLYPASITKVLTCLVTLENADLSETVTFSHDAIWNIDRNSSHIALTDGEQLSVEDCLYAICIASANEAAYGLAEHVGGGSLSNFTDMMNAEAKRLGCENSNFVNANGLHDENHYTCAYDMALITREALNYKTFRTLTSGESHVIPATNKNDARELYSKNKILNPNKAEYYEYAEGGKTGYTTDSLNTLVTYAKKDGLELVCVVLRCKGAHNAYTDTSSLFRYCYNNYKVCYPLSDFTFDKLEDSSSNYITKNFDNTIVHESLSYNVDTSYSLLIPADADVSTLTKEAEFFDTTDADGNAGKIVISYKDEVLGEAPITYSNIGEGPNPYNKDDDVTDSKKPSTKTKILIIVGSIVGVILITFIVFKIILSSRRRRRRNSRKRNYHF